MISSVDLTLDSSCILVSCRQSIQKCYCLGNIVSHCYSMRRHCDQRHAGHIVLSLNQTLIIMPAILKEASAMGALIVISAIDG